MGRRSGRPPQPVGRFVAAMRMHARSRMRGQTLPEPVRQALTGMPFALRRADVAELAQVIEAEARGTSDPGPISADDVANLEKGRTSLSYDKLYWLLRGLLFSPEEARMLIETDYFIKGVDSPTSGNGHLMPVDRLELFVGEFGPMIRDNTFRIADKAVTTWLEADKGSAGGYHPNELHIYFDESAGPVSYPDEFSKLIRETESDWEQRRKAGKDAPFNNPTLALCRVVADKDEEERNFLTLVMQRSKYSANAVAKGPEGARARWQALQDMTFPPKPVPYLASGVGVCINVLCDGGTRIVIGQRSHLENFRKGEYDVAVVEGIRPNANIRDNGQIDVHAVIDRALDEELGTGNCELLFGRPISEFVKQKSVFEFGCDLKYYQWNFLCLVEIDLSFDQISSLWKTAKDRRENQSLIAIPFERSAVEEFVLTHHIWSSGVACLLGSFLWHTVDLFER